MVLLGLWLTEVAGDGSMTSCGIIISSSGVGFPFLKLPPMPRNRFLDLRLRFWIRASCIIDSAMVEWAVLTVRRRRSSSISSAASGSDCSCRRKNLDMAG